MLFNLFDRKSKPVESPRVKAVRELVRLTRQMADGIEADLNNGVAEGTEPCDACAAEMVTMYLDGASKIAVIFTKRGDVPSALVRAEMSKTLLENIQRFGGADHGFSAEMFGVPPRSQMS